MERGHSKRYSLNRNIFKFLNVMMRQKYKLILRFPAAVLVRTVTENTVQAPYVDVAL